MLNTPLSADDLPGLIGHLYRDGLINLIDAHAAITTKQPSKPLHLLKNNVITNETLLCYCKEKFALPFIDLNHHEITFLDMIKPELVQRYRALPLKLIDQTIHLGITDPTDHSAISAISFDTGKRIKPFLIDALQLENIIDIHFQKNILYQQVTRKITTIEEPANLLVNDDEPIIELANNLISDAIKKNSSDIHIEPQNQDCRIRFRCDGLLTDITSLPSAIAIRLITRFKVMAELNIAEKRLPQDGRITITHPPIDIRISTCPTIHGEKIVLRLLHQTIPLTLDELGLTATQKAIFISKLHQPSGLILVTGPTGSGKTATLYAALQYLNHAERNISSVEDPVEIKLDGINQVQVNAKIGLDFSHVLRNFLRQDPDILMIGEIRDKETAEIAMQAAQTGHLVLATLHTNSAIATIHRLKTLGINIDEWISSIILIISQRLLRKYPPPGRIGIFELLTNNAHHTISDLLKHAQQSDSLWDVGLEKVRANLTTENELIRILGEPNVSTATTI